MKKLLLVLLFMPIVGLFAQENSIPPKYALVIGNSSYTLGLSKLANPVNDANDVAAALEYLGFIVDKLLDAKHEQMDSAVLRLKDKLSESGEAYGFIFYAGHGVQSGGENFLIPVDVNIPSESFLRSRSISVQAILDELNDARNSLNVVVLDACRDNPFGWSRSSSRGLSMISRQPAGSIIVYATSAGQTAADGDGRNGLFTSQLLGNLVTPGLEVKEIFNRTGADVTRLSKSQQVPAIYSQFFGTAFFGEPGELAQRPLPPMFSPVIPKKGKTINPACLWTAGASVGSAFSAPWLIATVRGTIAPFKNSFLELGFDYGVLSGVPDVSFWSAFPYIHYAAYLPFGSKAGLYAGAGAGWLISKLTYPEGPVPVDFPTINFIAGIILLDSIDVSYTIRTNFFDKGGKIPVSNKLSVGWVYRFR